MLACSERKTPRESLPVHNLSSAFVRQRSDGQSTTGDAGTQFKMMNIGFNGKLQYFQVRVYLILRLKNMQHKWTDLLGNVHPQL